MQREGIKKHATLFTLWLQGAEIEYRTPDRRWVYLSSPSWLEREVYRVVERKKEIA